jgi:hypothetical protein
VEIAGQWYVFYHRLTHKSDYSRQACAEKIYIDEKGHIPQVEITSCGLNDGALKGEPGYAYPAVISCNLTNGHMPHGSNSVYPTLFPNVTHLGEERFIAEIEDGTVIGYKYFAFKNVTGIQITARLETDENRVVYDGPIRLDERCQDGETNESEENQGNQGITCASKKMPDAETKTGAAETKEPPCIEIKTTPTGAAVGKIVLDGTDHWKDYQAAVNIPDGVGGLYLIYHGEERIQLKEFRFL